ncbi:MAG: Tim44/TimA family putative adaptor protein [Alphaproteobacteria bacterium]
MDGIPYGDIIVIGAIAAFILLRYRAMLGEKSGRDAKPAARPLEEYERIIQLPERETPRTKKPAEPAQSYGALDETLTGMRAIDREFSVEEFLEGARGAYEMVIEAYSKRDEDTLKQLLAPPILANFKKSLAEDEAAGRTQETTLVAIIKSELADAKLRGNVASITVEFHSEQVTLVRDKDGKIIEGDPSHQAAIEDRWTFERNLATADPNWKVVET